MNLKQVSGGEMEYNTQRKNLIIAEYGRNIQNMVEYVKSTEDRTERNRLALAVIQVMGQLNPHLRDVPDFKHKLWDHLFVMADFDLDIDSPYPRPNPAELAAKPATVPYNTAVPKVRFYGKGIEMLLKKCGELEEGEERKAFAQAMGNLMKTYHKAWNDENVSDEAIAKQMVELSNGVITPYEGMSFRYEKIQGKNIPSNPPFRSNTNPNANRNKNYKGNPNNPNRNRPNNPNNPNNQNNPNRNNNSNANNPNNNSYKFKK
jgi:hypothetical protein